MEAESEGMMLNEVLEAAARLTHEERHARIRRCMSEERHEWETLPRCVEPSVERLTRYCDRCWSVIDREGHTWSWRPIPD
jgi:hypothetical protein